MRALLLGCSALPMGRSLASSASLASSTKPGAGAPLPRGTQAADCCSWCCGGCCAACGVDPDGDRSKSALVPPHPSSLRPVPPPCAATTLSCKGTQTDIASGLSSDTCAFKHACCCCGARSAAVAAGVALPAAVAGVASPAPPHPTAWGKRMLQGDMGCPSSRGSEGVGPVAGVRKCGKVGSTGRSVAG